MIKISKDGLLFWRYFFPGYLIAMHLVIIIVICKINLWPAYLVYLLFFLGHFAIAKVWRLFLIRDVFLSDDGKRVYIGSGEKKLEFDLSKITECIKLKLVARLTIDNNGSDLIFYFMPASKDNVKFLSSLSEASAT